MSKVTLYEVPEDFAQSDESTDYDARAKEVKKVKKDIENRKGYEQYKTQ